MPPTYAQLKSYWNEPACEDLMKALADCNEENGFKRFLGTCDKHSADLNKCILTQKESRRLEPRKRTAAEIRRN